MDIIKAVSNRLSELCKERNITVNRLANLSAVPPSTVKNIVYGLSKNPKIITIKMLCDGLEITLAKFFDAPSFGSHSQNNGSKKPETSNADSGSINTLTAVTINNILYGKSMNPKLNTIKQICDGLGITLAEFFDTDEFNNLEQEIK